MQCSAKENKNIDEIFQNLLGKQCLNIDETIKRGLVKGSGISPTKSNLKKAEKDNNIKLTAPPPSSSVESERKKKKCC